jgi:hypothetical protein
MREHETSPVSPIYMKENPVEEIKKSPFICSLLFNQLESLNGDSRILLQEDGSGSAHALAILFVR